jgi:hypothetical protein
MKKAMRISQFAGIFLAATLFVISLRAHDVITTKLTYTREISRILAARCVSCHDAGSSIPLTTYEETRPWAVAIKEQVLSRSMPPWGAVKGFGHFMPDRALSQEEISIIAAWVIGGAPNGDPALLPKPMTQSRVQTKRAALIDARTVNTKLRLDGPLVLAGLLPLPDSAVFDVQVTATLPNGSIEPLIWLHGYQPAWQSTFRFEKELALPAGTVIEASGPLRFVLKTAPTAAGSTATAK